MFKKATFSLFCIFLLSFSIHGQTVIPVAAGTGQIAAAYTNAVGGDILELVTDGGIYIETAKLSCTKAVTIRAASNLVNKPVWTCNNVAVNALVDAYADLTINGIIMDGSAGGTKTGIAMVTQSTLHKLKLLNSTIKNFDNSDHTKGMAIYGSATGSPDSVIVSNCNFKDISNSAIIFYTNTTAPGAVKNLLVTNSIFWNIGSPVLKEPIYVEASDADFAVTPDPRVTIVNVTCYNTARILTHYCNYTIIRNCIFANPATGQTSYYIYGLQSSCTNSLYWNAAPSFHTAVTSGIINANPLFTNVATGDFSIPSNSPAYHAGTDGKSLGASFLLKSTLTLTAIIEGLFDGTSVMVPDRVLVELRDGSTTSLVDTASALLDASGQGTFTFANAVNGTGYYIAVKHRNAIETWSANAVSFTGGALSYDFTTDQSQAYGSNLIEHGGKWCLFSGDVNQDGIVDGGDLTLVDNDATNWAEGYLSTDVNADGIVDGGDLTIVDNNATNWIMAAIPTLPGAAAATNRMHRIHPATTGVVKKVVNTQK